MATRVRSYSKVNLGLAIGPVRADGFHGLTTLYQTLALHDVVTVSARAASETKIMLASNDRRVPTDARNTAWKMVERALARMGVAAEVEVHIQKNLPVQGGMGAGSANAAAALVGLERELRKALPGVERLEIAAEVGSDVPLFLLGGAVVGLGRGELVIPVPDLPKMYCVVAVPGIGVSTPSAFKEWDRRRAEEDAAAQTGGCGEDANGTNNLTSLPRPDKLSELSLAYASLSARTGNARPGTSGIVRDSNPEETQGLAGESQQIALNDLAENPLLALVRTGIGNDLLLNDFEEVVFPQYPLLRQTKRELMGGDGDGSAVYAALSGSGSALFGLYGSAQDAEAAQRRVQASGVEARVTETLPRGEYWNDMFAE